MSKIFLGFRVTFVFSLLRWRSRLVWLVIVSVFVAPASVQASPADTFVSPLFSDNAVLQRGKPIKIWGKSADQGRVRVEYGGVSAEAEVKPDGKWLVTLPSMKANATGELRFFLDDKLVAIRRNVAIGEVWLCSGQSNMEWPVRDSSNAVREMQKASNDSIRLLTIERTSSPAPLETPINFVGWHAAAGPSVEQFSAACFYFGRHLESLLNVPIGLIDASWGGSIARAWMSNQALLGLGYEEAFALNRTFAKSPELAWSEREKGLISWWQNNDLGSQLNLEWYRHDLDESQWVPFPVPGEWENSSLPGLSEFDGVVWFRKSFTLTDVGQNTAARLSLGPIDDYDTVWINGQLVGSGSGWQTPRHYNIQPGILRPGSNTIAVRVLDMGNGGGFRGASDMLRLALADGKRVSLSGEWLLRIGGEKSKIDAFPEIPWGGPHGVSTLYNGMIAPLTPMSIAGVAWYQGESDRFRPHQYTQLLTGFLADWRSAFANEELPFLIVQLASFGPQVEHPVYSGFAEIREIQRRVSHADPDAELVVTIDIGDRYDIHPSNKQEVGRRLSLAANRLVYEKNPDLCPSETIAAKLVGNSIALDFGACGILVKEADRPLGFQSCDDNGVCWFVSAELSDRSIITLRRDPKTSAIRYCWGDSPICNLTTSDDLPVSPFEVSIPGPRQ